MGKVKELREVIIKANPEIVELKMGCKIRKSRFWTDDVIFVGKDGNGKHNVWKRGYLDVKTVSAEDKIIGRPITLADVLMAIEKFGVKLEKSYTAEQQVMFQSNNLYKLVKLWNLKKNSLDNQSKETIDFLHNLLTNTTNKEVK